MFYTRFSQNLVLRAAFSSRRTLRSKDLKHVTFDPGKSFWQEDESMAHVLFPLSGIVSLQVSAGVKQVEVGMVGCEGFAGMSLFLGEGKSLVSAVALTSGEAVLMPRRVFQSFIAEPEFREAVNRYMRSFIVMLARISVCNRVHVIESLCVGRLLLMQDRTHTDSFQVTQDFFSRILGVRRATVSRAASQLQKRGAIQYDRRGRLTILDRGKLESSACSCYHAIKADFDDFVKSQGGF